MFRLAGTILCSFWALQPVFGASLQHAFSASTGSLSLNPYPDKPRLAFRADRSFKITIFSDLHFGENPDDGVGVVKDSNSTRLMRAVLHDEDPDYVVFNGDLITGDYTFRENSTLLIDQIMSPLVEAQVPFSSTHGNHDNQVNITHLEEIQREQEIAPSLCYTRTAPLGVGGIGGPGNYWVPIYDALTDTAPSLILWFFDSRGGVSPTGAPLPDWVDASVSSWIAREMALMNAAWGTPPLGALAFVHIAPHAIQALQPPFNSSLELGLNGVFPLDLESIFSDHSTTEDDPLGGGSVQDSNNIPDAPTPVDIPASEDPLTASARDAPFWTALSTIPNLHAIISGHAHGNEWCTSTDSEGPRFCFNKHSGYGGYDKAGWGHGVRNVQFSPNRVETWIRLEDGDTRANLVLSGA
ncbi:Metallo-dependent phosphatase [Mycena sanguinolenta]|uniref:Metallo-dependent phosphatase n=1 Tax=Mycena sanguinolenta TaxID=230812 RepID=A0A8H6YFL7_9AGAR|nr:Metallo-dependent phosphatase [Mycena sanguinolenta]